MTGAASRGTGGAGNPISARLDDIRLVVADLDGTLLHGAPTFEERYLTERSAETIRRMHDETGIRFAISTARPVSTGLAFAERLPADAVVYLNGALIDFDPAHSDMRLLTGVRTAAPGQLVKVGFDSHRACEVCRMMLAAIPDLEIGIVMDDVRYTNFDVRKYWRTQTWRLTDFSDADVPQGVADKIIMFPTAAQRERARALIPDDFDLAISEGTLWMLMNPNANKRDSLATLCERLHVGPETVVCFGDDLVDIGMMGYAGHSVAVANANPKVLAIADEICPANDDDGVARWIEDHLLG